MEPTAADIQEMIEGCRQNNLLAQKKLYSVFYPYCMHVCLPYTRQAADTDDILANAFIRIFQHIDQYDAEKGSLYAWVRKIVVHAALDFMKQHSRFTTSTLEEAEGIIIENAVVEKLSADELLQHIRYLPQATQAVFNLYCIEGYNHREIAQLLSIKEGTSKWHLNEARTLLKQRLLKPSSA